MPVSLDKTVWVDEMVVFLGILLDGRNRLLALPLDKKDQAIDVIKEVLSKNKATVKQLQKLCGILNFVGRAIFPGRVFMRRMYTKYSEVINFGGTPRNSYQYKLKQHHHVKIDAEFKTDCRIWLDFLEGEMQHVVNRPMVDLLGICNTSTDIRFYSDDSASKSLGFGAVLNNIWIRGDWGSFMEECSPSIEYLELFMLCAGVLTWRMHEDLINTRITVFCDNQVVVQMINNNTSSCKNCMFLLRLLTIDGLQNNRTKPAQGLHQTKLLLCMEKF